MSDDAVSAETEDAVSTWEDGYLLGTPLGVLSSQAVHVHGHTVAV